MNDLFDEGREVDLMVYVYQRPHMRDPSLEFELYMGRNVLDGIFDEMKMMPEITEVSFSFPENWLNIIEQRAFWPRLAKYCPNLKKVTVKTQSVYIIQCTPARCVRIVSITDQQNPNETDPEYKEHNTRLWVPMVGSLLKSDKLTMRSL